MIHELSARPELAFFDTLENGPPLAFREAVGQIRGEGIGAVCIEEGIRAQCLSELRRSYGVRGGRNVIVKVATCGETNWPRALVEG
jgi:hypothetical protein